MTQNMPLLLAVGPGFDSNGSCTPNPCAHNGTCVEEGPIYQCRCALGFTGWNCETGLACFAQLNITGFAITGFAEVPECESQPCHGNATCVDFVNHYECICAPGFTGPQCQTGLTVLWDHKVP